MAGKADIKAGGAFIELFTKNNVAKGLREGMAQVRDGALAIAAVGAAIVTPLAAALTHFVAIGGDLDDMAQRTGVSAQRLAFWNYAAAQTGARIEDIEKAMREVRKRGFTPEDFDRLAEEISRIPDPLARAARAAELFGDKTGIMLLPMFDQLPDLEARWKRLNLEPTQESIDLADELGDLWTDMRAAASALTVEIGAALAPAAKELAKALIPLVVQVRDWIRANPQYVQAIAAAGAALFALGTAGAFAATVVLKIKVLASLTGIVLAFAAAALLAVAAWRSFIAFMDDGARKWPRYARVMTPDGFTRDLAKLNAETSLFGRNLLRAFGAIPRLFGQLAGQIGTTSGKIVKALKVGEFTLAWEIAMADMTAAWHTFAAAVLKSIVNINRALTPLGEMLFGEWSIAGATDKLAKDELAKAFEATKKSAELVRQVGKSGNERPGQGGRPEDYPLPTFGAAVIGSNANAVLRSQQIMGGGRNPVHDTLVKILALDLKLERHLASIDRKTRPMRWR